MRYEIGEVEQIITPDGDVFSLNNGFDRAVSRIGGRGMPGVEYLSYQGYMQPYPVVTGWKLQARTVALTLSFSMPSRDEYWQRRAELMAALRFNRGGALVLRHIRGDGTRLDLTCYPDSSPVWEDDFAWDEPEVEINLIAFNPLFADAEATTVFMYASLSEYVVFPVTFPVMFSSSSTVGSITINYPGTFVAYPQIEVAGPYDTLVLTNRETGAKIGLTQRVYAGQRRIIDLTPQRQTIVDGSGNDKFSELMLPESNLIAFNLRPTGQDWNGSPFEGVEDGINRIDVLAPGAGEETSVSLNYRALYLDVGG